MDVLGAHLVAPAEICQRAGDPPHAIVGSPRQTHRAVSPFELGLDGRRERHELAQGTGTEFGVRATLPIEGGLPKRITFENGGVTVLGWTAQGEVLVSTENSVGPAKHRIVAALRIR